MPGKHFPNNSGQAQTALGAENRPGEMHRLLSSYISVSRTLQIHLISKDTPRTGFLSLSRVGKNPALQLLWLGGGKGC